MNGLTILLISAGILLSAYFVYGRYLARKWGIDPAKKTPAREFEDGMDYVPTDPAVVFGHQFALMADAWHHRSDALSSIGAFIGILGAILGFPALDAAASLAICLFIAKAAYDIFTDAIDKMVDKSATTRP